MGKFGVGWAKEINWLFDMLGRVWQLNFALACVQASTLFQLLKINGAIIFNKKGDQVKIITKLLFGLT
ncbi:unnamed protein product, partial [marine sediment metagenome]